LNIITIGGGRGSISVQRNKEFVCDWKAKGEEGQGGVKKSKNIKKSKYGGGGGEKEGLIATRNRMQEKEMMPKDAHAYTFSKKKEKRRDMRRKGR